jgi:UPF0755 protein
MKRKVIAISILILVFLIWLQPVNFDRTEITIPEDANAREIAQYLSDNHIVRDINEFLFWLKISGKEKHLKSGTYELQRYKNPVYVINKLTRGGKSDIIITIPEGLTIYETAEILDISGIINKGKFISLCNDRDFIKNFGIKVSSLEGYLFPDTYSFSISQTDSEVISTFMKNFSKQIGKFALDPDSIDKIIIIASIIEKEAKLEEERPIIAKVFVNRIKVGRPLESCATVFYALKNINYEKYQTKTKLLQKDLKLNSPYNTYIHTGLPPGPICSPGENSIASAVSPADVDYLYFVSIGNGRHHFSKTFREHIAVKERYNAKK